MTNNSAVGAFSRLRKRERKNIVQLVRHRSDGRLNLIRLLSICRSFDETHPMILAFGPHRAFNVSKKYNDNKGSSNWHFSRTLLISNYSKPHQFPWQWAIHWMGIRLLLEVHCEKSSGLCIITFIMSIIKILLCLCEAVTLIWICGFRSKFESIYELKHWQNRWTLPVAFRHWLKLALTGMSVNFLIACRMRP